MRLIDADELLKIYKKWIPQLLSEEDEGDRRGVETCIMVLEDMQTVDAVPVVRCRECKHLGFCGDATNLEVMGFYGYCSRGERKEGADNG